MLLKQIKSNLGLLGGVVASACVMLMSSQIVPRELSGLNQFAAIVTLLVLVLVAAVRANQIRVPGWLGMVSLLVALGSAVAILVIKMNWFFCYPEMYVAEDGLVCHLTGWSITAQGQEVLENLAEVYQDVESESSMFSKMTLLRAGPHRIPDIYGGSFIALKVLYASMYLLMFASAILCIGVFPRKQGLEVDSDGTDKDIEDTLDAGSRPTKILLLASDPIDASRLRLGQEVRDIERELRMASLREAFSFQTRFCVRAADLSRALLETSPKIVHFSGHGTERGELCLENEDGKTLAVAPEDLASLFELVKENVRCVVLNACYSEEQARAISRSIPNVIGMDKAVSDKAAIAFSVGFYQAIGAGKSYAEAYRFGCAQIRLQGVPEHLTPVLISRSESTSG